MLVSIAHLNKAIEWSHRSITKDDGGSVRPLQHLIVSKTAQNDASEPAMLSM